MRKLKQFTANLASLEKAYEQDLSNPFIISGIVEQFAVQFELGWKVLRELAVRDGILKTNTGSPRSIIKEAFPVFDFLDGELWLEMLADRNGVLHLYDQANAEEVARRVLDDYIDAFRVLAREAEKRTADWATATEEGAGDTTSQDNS